MQSDFAGVRWIFFDVGYTLLDETAAWNQRFQMMSKLLLARGMDVPPQRMWKLFDAVCQAFEPLQWLGLCKRLQISPAEATELGKGYQHDLESPHAGAVNLLATLAGTYKLGVIANQSLGTAQRLEKHGMRKYIDLVIGSAEAGVRKPDAKIFQMALEQARCAPAEAVMVGDRIDNDIAPANALGWRTIHVRQGGSRLQTPRCDIERATATVDAVAEVAVWFGL